MSGFVPSDQYGFAELLTDDERLVLTRLRAVLDTRVRPLLADHWERAAFPSDVVEDLVALRLMDPPELTRDGVEPSLLYGAFRTFELARVDASIATFHNAQSGLFRTTVRHGGSPEQADRWDPLVRDWTMRGVFSLTEPDHGSDIAGGLETAARRSGDTWTIDGAKRWIGGASTATHLAVFARDAADGAVKGFLVPADAPGVTITPILRKASLRIMPNSDIRLDHVEIDDEWRLGRVDSFADVARLLRRMRSDVAWIATGMQAGAYEAALAYTRDRLQFGRPVASFQLVQAKLATMLGNLTSSLALVVRLTALEASGRVRDEDSALAKLTTAARLRETVALAREVVGGNGIVLDHDVARFHADAEAVYSYEGTNEINALLVGRAATGFGAFR